MCPICIAATALLVAGRVTVTGGLAAIGLKSFSVKYATPSKEDRHV